jgi:hypothetical protein
MRTELRALAAVAGPTLTPAEMETRKLLDDMDAVARHIDSIPREQRMERSAAVLAQIVKPADAEAVRAAYWLRLPLAVRMVAVMSARLPKERANDALNKFDAFERGIMWRSLERLIADLHVTQKCMNGGAMPVKKGPVQ